MTDNTYRVKNAGKITHSKLSDFIKCPKLYEINWIDEALEDETSDALTMGSAFDLYMRDKDTFSKKYEILAKGKKRVGESEWIQLTDSMGNTIKACEKEFLRQPLYSQEGQMQYVVEIEYKGQKISGEIDEFRRDEKIIIDDKTCASLNALTEWKTKYRRQLAFYQWLVEMKEGIRCAGAIRAVTKEDVPKSDFFFAPEDSLFSLREGLLESLDALIEATKTKNFIPHRGVNRENCLSCKAYSVCPHSVKLDDEITLL